MSFLSSLEKLANDVAFQYPWPHRVDVGTGPSAVSLRTDEFLTRMIDLRHAAPPRLVEDCGLAGHRSVGECADSLLKVYEGAFAEVRANAERRRKEAHERHVAKVMTLLKAETAEKAKAAAKPADDEIDPFGGEEPVTPAAKRRRRA